MLMETREKIGPVHDHSVELTGVNIHIADDGHQRPGKVSRRSSIVFLCAEESNTLAVGYIASRSADY